MTAFLACAWCLRPIAPKAHNLDMERNDGSRFFVHGSCAAHVVNRCLEERAMNAARNRNENGTPLPAGEGKSFGSH